MNEKQKPSTPAAHTLAAEIEAALKAVEPVQKTALPDVVERLNRLAAGTPPNEAVLPHSSPATAVSPDDLAIKGNREQMMQPEHPNPASSPVIPCRRAKRETVVGWFIALALVGGAAWYFISIISAHSAAVRKRQDAETKQQQTKQQTAAAIAALAVKYNAVTNWQASLPDGRAFSIDVSRALIRSASGTDDPLGIETRPVLVKCDLKDIAEKAGKIIVSFSSWEASVDLALELQCSPDQLRSFAGTNELSQFAVVARCREVQRLSGDAEGFSVKGELLDVLRLP